MPVVKSRNILFQGAGHSVSEGFPEKSISIYRGSQKLQKKPLKPVPTWNSYSANTADSLSGEKVFGSWLDRTYQYKLEYFDPFYLLNSLGFLLTRECGALSFDIASGISLALHQHSFEGIPLLSCAWLTLYRKWRADVCYSPWQGEGCFRWCEECTHWCVQSYGCGVHYVVCPFPFLLVRPLAPVTCSQHLKGNPPAWHIVAATVTPHDALRVRYLRNFLGQ